MDSCTLWFEGSWSACCAAHDAAYAAGAGTRFDADLGLALCVADAAGWPMAALMFAGVTLGGWFWWWRARHLRNRRRPPTPH